MIKRTFDVVAASIGLLLLSPVFLLVAFLVKFTSRGPVFFRQERVGKNFRPFRIYKFRSMVVDAPRLGGAITASHDPRITTIGHVIRKTKLDELPQLLNVLVGDMSLVGPRPEVPRYVEMFRDDYKEVLQVKPGITDLASVRYRDESELLGKAADPDRTYINEVLPDKIQLAKEYIRKSSFTYDLGLILRTLWKVVT